MIRHLKIWEEKCLRFADRYLPFCALILRRYARVWRFIASGGTAAVVDLGLLYLLTDVVRLHYLFSAVLAFIAAFCVSFVLQKFWTFEDASIERVHIQISISFIVGVINLILNTLLMYLFVDLLNLWYMAAQFIAGALLAFESFFVSRHFIFKKSL